MSAPTTPLGHDALIQESWARCRRHGLDQLSAPHFDELAGERLSAWLAPYQSLLDTTHQEVLPYYDNILGNSNCLIRLADAQGRVLKAWGRQRFTDPIRHRGLSIGASWLERTAGTNAIGTALACGQAVHIEHDEHFLKANRFMAGSAAPIVDAQRQVIAVLDVASDSYLPPSHTLGMVRMMSQTVENRLIRNAYGDGYFVLTFNTGLNNLDSQWAGLLIFDDSGRVLAANRRADSLLGLALPGKNVEDLFKHPLHEWLAQRGQVPFALLSSARNRLQCLLQPPTPKAPKPALAQPCIHHGDPQVIKALTFGGRLLEKDIALLVRGETGVGKEVLVRALHRASSRARQPLVAVNCAAIPAELVESELFGYEKGAFTGAHHKGNPGLIRKADKGILFLDEIGDMPLPTQARLLRVLQERCIQPLGAGDPQPVDIRVVSATHEDLRQRVAEGRFREDLYYRVCGASVTMPPLRERTDKRELIEQLCAGQPLSPAVQDLLLRHPWPGNVRQMHSVIQVALALCDGDRLEVGDLPEEFLEGLAVDMGQLLQATDGNISQLAKRLGVSRNTVYKRLREGGL